MCTEARFPLCSFVDGFEIVADEFPEQSPDNIRRYQILRMLFVSLNRVPGQSVNLSRITDTKVHTKPVIAACHCSLFVTILALGSDSTECNSWFGCLYSPVYSKYVMGLISWAACVLLKLWQIITHKDRSVYQCCSGRHKMRIMTVSTSQRRWTAVVGLRCPMWRQVTFGWPCGGCPNRLYCAIRAMAGPE